MKSADTLHIDSKRHVDSQKILISAVNSGCLVCMKILISAVNSGCLVCMKTRKKHVLEFVILFTYFEV